MLNLSCSAAERGSHRHPEQGIPLDGGHREAHEGKDRGATLVLTQPGQVHHERHHAIASPDVPWRKAQLST